MLLVFHQTEYPRYPSTEGHLTHSPPQLIQAYAHQFWKSSIQEAVLVFERVPVLPEVYRGHHIVHGTAYDYYFVCYWENGGYLHHLF